MNATREKSSNILWYFLGFLAFAILLLSIKNPLYALAFWLGIFSLIFLFIFPEFGLAGTITFSMIFPAILNFVKIEESAGIFVLRLAIILFSFLIYVYTRRKIALLFQVSVANIFFTLFFLQMIVGLTYTPLKEVGLNRVLFFVYTVGVPYYLMFFLDRETSLKIFQWTFAVALVMAILTFFTGESSLYETRITLPGTGLIPSARFYGIATIIGIENYFAYKTLKKRARFFYLFGFIIIALSLFLTGTRGAFVSLIVASVFYLLFFAPLSVKKKIMLVISIFILAGILFLIAQKGLAKYRTLAIGLAGTSVKLRLVMWKESIKVFVQHPLFGIGTGGASIEMGQFLLGNYPHNMILEILAEMGLLGLILFMGFLYGTAKNLLVLSREDQQTRRVVGLAFSLLVYTFISAMFSSTFGGNKEFFLVSAMVDGIRTEKGEKYGSSIL